MSVLGTRSYAGVTDLPPLVSAAVQLATELGFACSCRIEQGRLLLALAGGVSEVGRAGGVAGATTAGGATGRIGETGTGCGVGLAWLITGRRPSVRVVSVERDERRAERVTQLFRGVPDVDIIHGDWTLIDPRGPFDLLVLDGGGNGKSGPAADPERLLSPGGCLVIDDFTPMTRWPPEHGGGLDRARLDWLEHPALLATEIRLAPDLSTVVGTRRP